MVMVGPGSILNERFIPNVLWYITFYHGLVLESLPPKCLITWDILLIANLWYQKIHLHIEPSQMKKYFSDQNEQACNFEDGNPPVVTNLKNISRLLKKCSGTINNLSKSS